METKRVWRRASVCLSALALAACSGGGGGSDTPAPVAGPPGTPTPSPLPPPPPPAASSTVIESPEEAARFLAFASFGGTQAEINALVGRDAADWLEAQFNQPVTLYSPRVAQLSPANDRASEMHSSDLFWDGMVTNPDQLRTRMVFGLSQILVINDRVNGVRPRQAAYYMDVLATDAFGNYRDLMQEVTYSPIMAEWLTYFRNRKGDEATGRMPDENYARELLQLFTIGLVELNMDGTPRLENGQQVETFDNDDIVGLARVFTGLSGKGERFSRSDVDAMYSRLVMWNDEHSPLEKSFLGTTIPAGTEGDETISRALDTIFEHPNIAPFLSRQLIQRFTSSDPSPAYVGRVAAAFESGRYAAQNGTIFGTGERGDLEATVAAILLDQSLWTDTAAAEAGAGKVREPVLLFVHWARAFEISNVDAANERHLQDTGNSTDRLGQHPFRSPSVFNFYRPGFVAPNTETGAAGMTAPELQILNESSAIGYIDFLSRHIFDDSAENEDTDTWTPDYSEALALADDPAALADYLDLLLMGGRMEAATRADIIETAGLLDIVPERADEDRLSRVRVAVMITVNAPAYRVVR